MVHEYDLGLTRLEGRRYGSGGRNTIDSYDIVVLHHAASKRSHALKELRAVLDGILALVPINVDALGDLAMLVSEHV